MYVIVSDLGWVSTLQGLVVPGLFAGFTTFLFRQFFLVFLMSWRKPGVSMAWDIWEPSGALLMPNSYGIIAALSVITFIYQLE